jgi:hypothetical protein
MKYFAKTTFSTSAKNQATKAAQELGKKVSQTLIDNDEALNLFIENFKEEIDKINKEHPRCSDMSFHYRIYKDFGESYMNVRDCFTVTFYEVKQEFPEAGRDWGRDLMGDMKADAS